MLKLENNNTILKFKDRTLFILNKDKDKAIAYFGSGKAKYKMNRGSFKVKDKIKEEAYYFEEIIEKNNKFVLILKSKNNKTAKLLLETKNNMLELKFDIQNTNINRFRLQIFANKTEKVYGCGEQFAKFNLRGEKVKIWVEEHVSLNSLLYKAFCYQFGLTPKLKKFSKYASYIVQPTFITSDKIFVHTDTAAYSEMDFRAEDYFSINCKEIPNKISIGVENNYETLMEKLTGLLGRQELLPDWCYDGMILGIQDGTNVCNDKMKTIKAAGGKVAGIWAQDWEGQRITAFGKQLMWNWKWDEQLYKGLDKQLEKWNEENIAFLGYINPFLATEGELYKEASTKGFVVKNKEGEDYLVKITTFPAAMIDFSTKEGYEWTKEIIKKNMIEFGLKGWMADFGEYLPTDAVLGSGENPEQVHNLWPMRWAQVNMDAIKECGMENEILFFTRAGYTGTAKNTSLVWNGDQHVDWSRDYGIGSIVNSQLALSVSGVGVSHSDVGGYTSFGKMRRSKELLLRWTEMNAFSAVMRSHEGNRPDVCAQFDSDEETINHTVKFSNIHYKLKPYIKEAVELNHEAGTPVVRPLFFYYDEEECYHLDDTYLFGRDILIKPVVQPNQNRTEIYLPDDEWIHLWTGKEYSQGKQFIDSHLGYPPVFYRKNSKYAELFKSLV